jgi:hypothetical protein
MEKGGNETTPDGEGSQDQENKRQPRMKRVVFVKTG